MQPLAGRLQDPNRVNLRKAGRATLVVPTVFAILVVTGNTPSALFGAFGSFSALVFADFGGALPRRFRAYVLLALVGGALVALGTAFADTVWPAVVVTLVVAFAVSFSGALGGYFASGGTAAILAFVLAVMSPGVEADLAARELGWVLGVVVAAVAAVAVWPVHQRDRVRAAAGEVLTRAAAALAEPAATRDLTALRAADAELATRAGVVYRPAGSITKERALVSLVVATRHLANLLDLVTSAEQSTDADTTPEYAALRRGVADALVASERALAGDAGDVEVETLTAARQAHNDALERWAATALHADDGAPVIQRFSAAFPLRRLALAVTQIATNANATEHDTVRSRAEGEAMLAKAWTMLRAHCTLRSVRFRNAARAGVGLAIAVLVAKTTSVEHAFWVVLGALSVLRSNALGTGATALQALVGALVGFGLASVVMETVGGDDTWLWIALPLVVFLAAYTPGAVNFVVGQASFTVFVVVLFNILVPDGWRTGLVRVQDVAIGAGISVAVGALLWPRGASGVARRSFAELLRAGGGRLAVTTDVVLRGTDGDVAGAAQQVVEARARAVAALEDLALEHGGGQVDRAGWDSLLVEALVLDLAADGILRTQSVHGPMPGCADARAALADEGRALSQSVDAEADRLVRAGAGALARDARPSTPVPPELARCLAERPAAELHAAIGLIWDYEWLALVAEHPG